MPADPAPENAAPEQSPPMVVAPVLLAGSGVRLEPLSPAHRPGLAAAIEDGALWQIPLTFVPHPDDLGAFVDDATAALRAGRELAFAIIDSSVDAPAGRVVGSTRFRAIEARHRRVEIGFTFLAASAQRSHVNTAAKYLMLRHAFEAWGCHRVELLTDERNARSRAAILRLGAREEGLLRCHMVMRDGHVRHSVIFSLIAAEWPKARRALERKLDPGS